MPITRWNSGGDWVDFALYYHSANNLLQFSKSKRRIPPGFSSLSEKNSKWVHSFDPWILYLARAEDGRQEVYLHEMRYHATYSRVIREGKFQYVSQDPRFRPILSEAPQQVEEPISCKGQSLIFNVPATLILDMPDMTRYVFGRILWHKEECEAYAQYLLTEYVTPSGRRLNVTRRAGENPQVLTVKDEDGKGLTFNYQNGLLVSVTDPDERTHTFSYSPVPDENNRPQRKLSSVHIRDGSETSHTWTFRYRDDREPERLYGGTYTGDLVIHKKDINGKEAHYSYAPVSWSGKPPQIRRPKLGDWNGRIVRVEALNPENGRIKKEVFLREDRGSHVVMTAPGKPPEMFPCEDSQG